MTLTKLTLHLTLVKKHPKTVIMTKKPWYCLLNGMLCTLMLHVKETWQEWRFEKKQKQCSQNSWESYKWDDETSGFFSLFFSSEWLTCRSQWKCYTFLLFWFSANHITKQSHNIDNSILCSKVEWNSWATALCPGSGSAAVFMGTAFNQKCLRA